MDQRNITHASARSSSGRPGILPHFGESAVHDRAIAVICRSNRAARVQRPSRRLDKKARFTCGVTDPSRWLCRFRIRAP